MIQSELVEMAKIADRALNFARRLLDPEDLGLVANKEIRDEARKVLGLEPVESKLNKGE